MKLLIVGDGGVGKSSFLNRLKRKPIKEIHVPTLGIETEDLNYKGYQFTIWDTSGTEQFAGLKDGYYIGSDCAIIMLSDTETSYNKTEYFKHMIINKCGNIPIVFVVNKLELNNTSNNYKNLERTENNVILISCKENINIYEPLNRLIRLFNIL